jgi:hypothetical protein
MKRTLALGAAWTASAGVAVGLGFLAVSLVDASASPGTQPVAAVATTTPGATSSSTAGPVPSATTAPGGPGAPAPGASVEQVTDGGTVYASCDGGVPVLAGAPSPGWWVDDPSRAGEVEFEDGTTKIEVAVSCAGSTPSFFVEGPRDDDGGREDGPATRTSAATPSPSPSSSPDDSDGRRGGGHGSDDGPGDDSSGRDGGGHGSDD